jgi:hypothetical protein
MLCSLVGMCWCFGGTCCLHWPGSNPKDGGTRFILNISKFVPYCMALCLRWLIFTVTALSVGRIFHTLNPKYCLFFRHIHRAVETSDKASSCLFLCPSLMSAWDSTAHMEQIFVRYNVCDIYQNLWTFHLWLKLDKNNRRFT